MPRGDLHQRIEALRARSVPIAGLLFVGEPHADNEATIPAIGGVRSFGRLPDLDPLDAGTLAEAMRAHVDLAGLRAAIETGA